jgi:hypothetical protein
MEEKCLGSTSDYFKHNIQNPDKPHLGYRLPGKSDNLIIKILMPNNFANQSHTTTQYLGCQSFVLFVTLRTSFVKGLDDNVHSRRNQQVGRHF